MYYRLQKDALSLGKAGTLYPCGLVQSLRSRSRELDYPLKSLSRSRARGFLRDEFGVLLVEFSLIRTMD